MIFVNLFYLFPKILVSVGVILIKNAQKYFLEYTLD